MSLKTITQTTEYIIIMQNFLLFILKLAFKFQLPYYFKEKTGHNFKQLPTHSITMCLMWANMFYYNDYEAFQWMTTDWLIANLQNEITIFVSFSLKPHHHQHQQHTTLSDCFALNQSVKTKSQSVMSHLPQCHNHNNSLGANVFEFVCFCNICLMTLMSCLPHFV